MSGKELRRARALDRVDIETEDKKARAKLILGLTWPALAENVLAIPLYHQDCFIYTSDYIDTAAAAAGNDQFAYEKDILNWTTTREDGTLYTDGGPMEYYMDPTVNPGQYLYQELVFERLLKADGQLNPGEGQLAESYTMEDRNLEFTLREDLFWQDGEPLTAEDVKFTFELYMKCPGANSVLTGVLDALEGAEAWKNGDAEACRNGSSRIISGKRPSAPVLTEWKKRSLVNTVFCSAGKTTGSPGRAMWRKSTWRPPGKPMRIWCSGPSWISWTMPGANQPMRQLPSRQPKA